MRQLTQHGLTLQNYDAICFDFDGTLVPCLDLRAMKNRLVDFTVEKTGIAREEIMHMMMVEFIDHTNAWLNNKGIENNYFSEAHELITRIELDAAKETQLFPGTEKLLRQLTDQGLQIGVVTRNCEKAVRTMYPELDDVCAALVARDHTQFLKPDPRHLQQCLDQMNVCAEKCVMVGDGIIDIEIAHALDMHSIAVTSGHNSEAELQQANPSWLLSHVNELRHCL
ncbi:MAG: HAD family hydrolase [Pseudomonadota bacterium]